MSEELYDVWAVNIETATVRMMATNKTLANADAVIAMAVDRRGVETEFYAKAPAGRYVDGNKWNGAEG